MDREKKIGTGHLLYLLLVCGSCLIGSTSLQAQTANSLIRKGNQRYHQQQYTEAEAYYKKALEKDSHSGTGYFNLGNSLYQQKRYEDAYKQYETSSQLAKEPGLKSDASYNMGNTFLENRKWEESIQQYKQALKLNPRDEDARYNLAYAQAMLKKQQQKSNEQHNQQHKNQQQQKNKDQNEQQNKNQEQRNKQQQNPKDQNQNQEPGQNQTPPPPSKLSKQEADRLLQALAQQEKKLQDKLKKAKGTSVKVEKDW